MPIIANKETTDIRQEFVSQVILRLYNYLFENDGLNKLAWKEYRETVARRIDFAHNQHALPVFVITEGETSETHESKDLGEAATAKDNIPNMHDFLDTIKQMGSSLRKEEGLPSEITTEMGTKVLLDEFMSDLLDIMEIEKEISNFLITQRIEAVYNEFSIITGEDMPALSNPSDFLETGISIPADTSLHFRAFAGEWYLLEVKNHRSDEEYGGVGTVQFGYSLDRADVIEKLLRNDPDALKAKASNAVAVKTQKAIGEKSISAGGVIKTTAVTNDAEFAGNWAAAVASGSKKPRQFIVGDQHIIIMEKAQGKNLSAFLQEKTKNSQHLQPREKNYIANNIIEAISRIHYAGILHGDIKPHNIMITPQDYKVTFVDFGICQSTEFASHLSSDDYDLSKIQSYLLDPPKIGIDKVYKEKAEELKKNPTISSAIEIISLLTEIKKDVTVSKQSQIETELKNPGVVELVNELYRLNIKKLELQLTLLDGAIHHQAQHELLILEKQIYDLRSELQQAAPSVEKSLISLLMETEDHQSFNLAKTQNDLKKQLELEKGSVNQEAIMAIEQSEQRLIEAISPQKTVTSYHLKKKLERYKTLSLVMNEGVTSDGNGIDNILIEHANQLNLKIANILLAEGKVKIGGVPLPDSRSGILAAAPLHGMTGLTPAYKAPECTEAVLARTDIASDSTQDMYSIALVLANIELEQHNWHINITNGNPTDLHEQLCGKIKEDLAALKLTEEYQKDKQSQDRVDLIIKMLEPDPKKRLTTAEVAKEWRKLQQQHVHSTSTPTTTFTAHEYHTGVTNKDNKLKLPTPAHSSSKKSYAPEPNKTSAASLEAKAENKKGGSRLKRLLSIFSR